MSSLSIRNLSKSYGAARAVAGVDLDVAEGELVVLLGPSGCGKTTTLRCVAGLEDVSGGTISIGDRIVSQSGRSLPPEERQIGMVFQSYAIWPHMTVAQNVSFGLKLQRLSTDEIARRVDAALDLVGLETYATRYVSQLSGGQQQRVALARAMALEPRILLFDEPLSNLDAKLREKMRFELRRIQQRLGITSLYVTHDQQEAMVIADRVVLMRNGLIEQVGSPVDLYYRPATRFVAEFIGLANIFAGDFSNGAVRLSDSVTLRSAATVPSGPVEVIFRPEQMVISETPLEGPNTFQGSVSESFFLGNTTDLEITVSGLAIRAQLSPPKLYKPGTALWLRIPPEQVIVLPRTGAPMSEEAVA